MGGAAERVRRRLKGEKEGNDDEWGRKWVRRGSLTKGVREG